jgi:hypothetical protein
MFDFVKLWNQSKCLFFLLLPVIIGVIIFKVLKGDTEDLTDLVNQMQDTHTQDQTLVEQQTAANTEAHVSKEKADKIEQQIQDIRKSDGDADWHKKR